MLGAIAAATWGVGRLRLTDPGDLPRAEIGDTEASSPQGSSVTDESTAAPHEPNTRVGPSARAPTPRGGSAFDVAPEVRGLRGATTAAEVIAKLEQLDAQMASATEDQVQRSCASLLAHGTVDVPVALIIGVLAKHFPSVLGTVDDSPAATAEVRVAALLFTRYTRRADRAPRGAGYWSGYVDDLAFAEWANLNRLEGQWDAGLPARDGTFDSELTEDDPGALNVVGRALQVGGGAGARVRLVEMIPAAAPGAAALLAELVRQETEEASVRRVALESLANVATPAATALAEALLADPSGATIERSAAQLLSKRARDGDYRPGTAFWRKVLSAAISRNDCDECEFIVAHLPNRVHRSLGDTYLLMFRESEPAFDACLRRIGGVFERLAARGTLADELLEQIRTTMPQISDARAAVLARVLSSARGRGR